MNRSLKIGLLPRTLTVASTMAASMMAALMLVSVCLAQNAAPVPVTRPAPVAAAQVQDVTDEAAPQLAKSARDRVPGLQSNAEVLLPNGWSLAPEGTQIEMGDFPTHIQVTKDGKFAAVLHCGWGAHEIRMVSLGEKPAVTSTTSVPQAFYGLSFSADDSRLLVSGGEDECVYVYSHKNGFLGEPTTVQIVDKEDEFVVSGVVPVDAERMLVCGLLSDEVRIVKLDSAATELTVKFPEESFPYAAVLDANSTFAYVSLWGVAKIAKVDLKSGEIVASMETRSHPTEMHLLDNDQRLLVACSNQNSVVLLDTDSGQQREVIQTALYAQAANGSTPSSLCVSPDGKVLVAANADNNNLAVFDISERGKSTSLGFIPVGWYPTSVRFDASGERLLVANGKGLTSRSNIHGPNPNLAAPASVREYVGGLFRGTLGIIDTPAPAEMAKMTRAAYNCSPLRSDAAPVAAVQTAAVDSTAPYMVDNPIPQQVGGPSPIKHCVYIIKENRTYDQVFGDMPQGNGDPSLCIFPEAVTPNHHALAREFVLLDNFYVESEVSADGHEWTMAAYATDFVEKTWPLSYRGGRGKLTYPAEGKFKIAEPSSGYLWDKCREAGVSYFSFGEFVNNGPTPDDPATTKIEALQGHFDPQFRSYDLEYPDVKRAERFLERWQEFELAGNLPQMIIVRLPNDHTYGTRVDKPTPTAMVAENDLALGMIVEGISKSSKWKETAIFVVEDDAQNGADHVDAHRTVALAISPYTRRAGVDSTLYSTSSMLRTMELILGVQPMTQFDAAATPMYRSFHNRPDFSPFIGLPAQVDVNAKNLATAWGAKESEMLDLSREDAADDLLFGDIIWRSVKGADHPAPAPVRAAFVFAEFEEEDEDHDE